MKKYHFKTPLYDLYAPYLYKIKRRYTRWLGCKWRMSTEQIDELVSYNWDRYLSRKFYAEVPYLFGKRFNLKKIKKKSKSSDTIFILGCGSSINDLTDEDWLTIKQFDSVGVNYFYAHNFKPTYHMIELGTSEESAKCLNKNLLNMNSRSSEQVFIHLRHLLSNETVKLDDSNNNLHLYSPSVLKGVSDSYIGNILSKWYDKKDTLIHHASNLDCTIHFAYQMGYKNIYLLGVDLNHNQYFWDTSNVSNDALYDVKKATDQDYIVSNFNRDPNAVHATLDKEKTAYCKSLTIVEYLAIVNELIFKKRGVNFATCSPNSLLKEHFNFVNIKGLK